jgi:hypothetical protein
MLIIKVEFDPKYSKKIKLMMRSRRRHEEVEEPKWEWYHIFHNDRVLSIAMDQQSSVSAIPGAAIR